MLAPALARNGTVLLALAIACTSPAISNSTPWPKDLRHMTDRSTPLFSYLYPPVWEATPRPVAIYRVVWLGAFHRPFAVTITRDSAENYFAHFAEPQIQPFPNEYLPPLARPAHLTRRLSAAEWDAATTALVSGGFWSLDHDSPGSSLDGSTWQIEGYEAAARYHYSMCRPGGCDPYKVMALPLISLMLDSMSLRELY